MMAKGRRRVHMKEKKAIKITAHEIAAAWKLGVCLPAP